MLLIALMDVLGSLGPITQTITYGGTAHWVILGSHICSNLNILGATVNHALRSAYASPADQPSRSQSY